MRENRHIKVFPVGHELYPVGAVIVEAEDLPVRVLTLEEFGAERVATLPAPEVALPYDSAG